MEDLRSTLPNFSESSSSFSSSDTNSEDCDHDKSDPSNILEISKPLPSDEIKSSSGDSETEESLASLAIFVENHIKPHYKNYNNFATSYITTTIPSLNRILCDETGSYTADPPPFKTPVKDRNFALLEKRRKEMGESTRKSNITPASKLVLKEIKNCNKNIKDRDNRRSYFFFKARQWCEVTKALTIDAKYPKSSVTVIRDKYSEEHRNALKISRKAKGLTDKTRIFEAKTQISPFPIPLELLGQDVNQDLPGYQAMAEVVQEEEKAQAEVRETLATLFGDILPIQELQLTTEEPWQFKARKTVSLKPKPVKKVPWKRTEYPPKSKEEKIADLRKLLPEAKPDNLQTDYLSGIWEPELMNETFNISGLNFDSRIPAAEIDTDTPYRDTGSAQVDWWIVHDAKEKCKNWLLSTSD